MGNRMAEAYIEVKYRMPPASSMRPELEKAFQEVGANAGKAFNQSFANEAKRGQEMRLKGVHDETLKLKADLEAEAKSANALYARLMGPMLPPRMDQIPGRGPGGMVGGAAGRGFSQMAIQASYGLQDFITVMAGGGSFQQAMIGATNNLGMMFMNIDKLQGGFRGLVKEIRANQGALAGLAISTLAVTLPTVIEHLADLWKNTTAAALKYKDAIDRIQMAHQVFQQGREHGGRGVELQAMLGLEQSRIEEAKAGGPAEREGARHAFIERDRHLKQQIEHDKALDKGDEERIRQNLEQQKILAQKLKSDSSRQALDSAKIDRRTGKVIPGPGFSQGDVEEADRFSKSHGGMLLKLGAEQRKEIERQLQALQDETAAINASRAQRVKDIQAREQARQSIAGGVAAENDEKRSRDRESFFRRFDRMQEETGNEFQNRRNRINQKLDEEYKDIDKAVKEGTLTPAESKQQREQAFNRAEAARADVNADQRRSFSRLMRQMESEQKGTGSVAAIRERLEERLERINRDYGPGKERDSAVEQARQTAIAENRRIINSMRPKGGQFFGIEQFSQHLMSEIIGGNPDEKAIREATQKAAQNLDTILQQGVKVIDLFVLGAR